MRYSSSCAATEITSPSQSTGDEADNGLEAQRLERHEHQTQQQAYLVLRRQHFHRTLADTLLQDRTQGHAQQRSEGEQHPGEREARQHQALEHHRGQPGQRHQQPEQAQRQEAPFQ